MAEQSRPKRLALDTNVLMDLAAGEGFAKSFVEKYQARGYDLRVPPTVLIELAYFATRGEGEKQRLAEIALKAMRGWRITPIVMSDMERRQRENFVTYVQDRRLLPPKEEHDALILAEVSVSDFNALVTSDRPLLESDHDGMAIAFNDAGLSPVAIVHPARMVKALR